MLDHFRHFSVSHFISIIPTSNWPSFFSRPGGINPPVEPARDYLGSLGFPRRILSGFWESRGAGPGLIRQPRPRAKPETIS